MVKLFSTNASEKKKIEVLSTTNNFEQDNIEVCILRTNPDQN